MCVRCPPPVEKKDSSSTPFSSSLLSGGGRESPRGKDTGKSREKETMRARKKKSFPSCPPPPPLSLPPFYFRRLAKKIEIFPDDFWLFLLNWERREREKVTDSHPRVSSKKKKDRPFSLLPFSSSSFSSPWKVWQARRGIGIFSEEDESDFGFHRLERRRRRKEGGKTDSDGWIDREEGRGEGGVYTGGGGGGWRKKAP